MAIFRGAYMVIATVLLAVVPALLYASESPGSITLLQRTMQSADLEVSARCRNHTLFYVQELHRGEPWALKMFDSSAKPESGVLTGGLTFLGFYSECLETLPRVPVMHETEARKTSPPFASQYCLLTLGLPDQDSQMVPVNHVPGFLWDKIRGKDVRFGICTPSTCTEEDVSNIGSQLLQQVGATKNTTHSECTSGEKEYVPIPTFVVVTEHLKAFIGKAIYRGGEEENIKKGYKAIQKQQAFEKRKKNNTHLSIMKRTHNKKQI